MTATNAGWLAQVQEEALDPDFRICDPHHHLWDRREGAVEPRYLLDELMADLSGGHRIRSTVFVECGAAYRTDGPAETRVAGETEFVDRLAAQAGSEAGENGVAAGIVGTARLDEGDRVAATLDAHLEASPDRFRGIRQAVAWDGSPDVPAHRTAPPPGLMASDRFRAGLRHVARRGLVFDLWCYQPQLPEALDLALSIPELTVVLDHMGGPLGVGPYAGRAEETYRAWRKDIVRLADCPNVVAKLGGINMELNGFGWHTRPRPPTSRELAAATRRYYEHVIQFFTPERCMFESNFPVDKVSCSYTVLWNAFKRMTADYSLPERHALFHRTAELTYRIGY